ncbi:LOW QUALITY PROTEIN: TBC1 domain family member 12-like [Myotis lucifugus]|uniref:LOW QUALITY PROTEIN: TBC1 domain family member 12-like n=1 Tax=Myotis lucifugus TaxID=59463 RepID=UPI000CCC24BB|nr:LOW QUALITY PROTEIN: TBC1 domain family member 12-like [Myotis lucifugus]
MLGPEDAGGCSGRNPKLLPVPAPESAGQDGKMIRATGGFGGGVGAVEPPEEGEEEEEETPPQQLFRRYLAAAGGQLEPGLCSCPLPAGQCRAPAPSAAPHPAPGSKHRGAEAAGASAPRHGGMTNGDSGFLPGQDCRDLEEARGLARAGGREPRRNLFSKRTKELKSVVHSAPGWKLFGKVPPRENLQKTSKIIQQLTTLTTDFDFELNTVAFASGTDFVDIGSCELMKQ